MLETTTSLGPRSRSLELLTAAIASPSPAARASRPAQPAGVSLTRSASLPGTAPARRQESQKLEAAAFPATLAQAEPVAVPEQAHAQGTFEELVRESDTAVLVDFYAPWCGPCQLMSRVVANLSQEMKGSLKVVKVNADNYPKLASKYRVQALPTCLLFRDGSLVDRVDGFMAEPTLAKRVRFYVSRLDKKFGRR